MHTTESIEIVKQMLLNTHSCYLFDEFLRVKHLFKGAEYWRVLSECYQSSNNLYSLRKQVKESFLSDEPDRNCLMSTKELRRFNTLPDKITIYRGMSQHEYESGSFGYSWTLKKSIAYFYVCAYRTNRKLHQLTIDKKHIIAYWTDNGQYEVFYLPQQPAPALNLP